jgi:predicted ATPase
MFTKLGIRNFKAWKGQHEIPLRPLTLVLGVNSAGKTSLLQPLLLLQQTAASPDRQQALNLGGQAGDLLHLGTMEDILSGHQRDLELAFDLSFHPTVREGEKSPENDLAIVAEVLEAEPIRFHAEYGSTPHGAPYVHRMSYAHEGATYEVVRQRGNVYALSVPGFPPPGAPSAAKRDYMPERSMAFSPEAVAALGPAGTVVQDFALALTRELSAIAYLGPLREYPARIYAWNGQMPGQLGVKGELAIQALLASANLRPRKEDPLGRGDLVAHVSRWLKEMDVAEALELERQGRSSLYEVVVVRGKERANLVDVGFGVSQVLPVIALAYFVPPGSTVILEQPEIHLHPLAQGHLADLLVEVSKERRVQFLVETHSEHLFRRLQSLIADLTTKPDQCALYFVGHDDEGASLKTLEVDDYGRVKNWPARFFGDAVGETERQMRQMLRRKKKERGGG